MVNIGKPSSGCHLCRKRRVKCDEQHPECRRCINIGKKCPGYREIAIFRDQNDWAQGAVGLRIAERNERDNAATAISSRQSAGLTAQPAQAVQPNSRQRRKGQAMRADVNRQKHLALLLMHHQASTPISLDFTPETYAISHFYSQYVLESGFLSVLDFLPKIPVDILPCLRDATPALGLAVMARQSKRYELMVKARALYGKALKSINIALHDKNKAMSDCVFVAVFLLGFYEFIACEQFEDSPWTLHLQGVASLIELRAKEQPQTLEASYMTTAICSHMLIDCFVAHKPMSPLIYRYFSLYDQSHPIVRSGNISVRAGKLAIDIYELLESPSALETEDGVAALISMIKAGGEITDEYQTWAAAMPDEWNPKLLPNPNACCPNISSPLTIFPCNCVSHPPQNLTIYPGIDECGGQIITAAMRVDLCKILLDAINRLDKLPFSTPLTASPVLGSANCSLGASFSQLATKLTAVVQEITALVCSSVPHLLGKIDSHNSGSTIDNAPHALKGYIIVFPCRAILGCEAYIDPKVAMWIREQLRYIGNVLGIGHALHVAGDNPNIWRVETTSTPPSPSYSFTSSPSTTCTEEMGNYSRLIF